MSTGLRRNSVQRRVTFWAGLTTVLALSIAGLAIHGLAQAMLYREFDADLMVRARELVALARSDPAHAGPQIDLVAAGALVDQDMGFQLWTADGTLLAGDQDLKPWHLVVQHLGSMVGVPRKAMMEVEGRGWCRLLEVRLVARPQAGGSLSPALVAVIQRPVAELEEQILRLDLLLISVLVVVTIVSVSILTWSIAREMRPVTALALEIAGRDRANFHQPLAVDDRRDEVLPVVTHLNALLARIDAAMVRERRFSAAAAHELRTPLAGLRATLDVALMDPAARPSERQRVEVCQDIVLQMQHLVDTLLLLARLDAGQVQGKAEVVRLDELLEELCQEWIPRAMARDQRYRLEVPPGLEVRTDPHLVRQVLTNLLGNAADHGRAGGEIAVSVRPHEAGVEVTIRNPGSQVRSEDAERVFERFWRADAGHPGGGHHCGLGLALCRDMVGVLGGRITAESRLEEEFTVRLWLPELV